MAPLDLSHYPHVAPIALSRHAHNRIAGRRTDEAWLRDAWERPSTRVLVLHQARLVVPEQDGRPTLQWLPTSEAPAGRRVLLGEYDGPTVPGVRFGLLADELPS